MITTSKQWTLNWRDGFRGLVVAVLTAVLTAAYQSLSAGSLTFNWNQIGSTALLAALGYLLKNLTEKSKIIITESPVVDKDVDQIPSGK